MKIVNRDTFIKLPEGTIFAEYAPCWFGPIMVKGHSITWPDTEGNDYLELSLTDQIEANGSGDESDKLFAAEKSGVSIPMSFNSSGRNGCFEYKQLYAVWERTDVEGLISVLSKYLEEGYK